MMLTELASVLRAAGLTVVEVPGWQTRSNDGNRFAGVRSIICHWTATPAHVGGDYPSLNIVTHGRSDLPGALSQLGLGRNGTWYVIAAGVAWHAGVVDRSDHDNWHAIGIEAEYHPDQGPWPAVQERSYERGVAALRAHYGVPLSEVQGHYEVARPLGRKTDPNTLPGGMSGFRQRVAATAIGKAPDQARTARALEDDTMLIRNLKTGETAVLSGGVLTGVSSTNANATNQAAGGGLMLGVDPPVWDDMVRKSRVIESLGQKLDAIANGVTALAPKSTT